MKKVIIIFLSFFLLFSTIDYGVSKPLSLESSIVSSERSINLNVADNVHEPLNFSNIKKFNGHFIENQGQIKEEIVKYYLQGKGVWFLNDGVVFEITESLQVRGTESPGKSRESGESIGLLDRLEPGVEPEIPAPRKSVVLKLNFVGSNKVQPKGVGLLPHRSNYFYGNDSRNWCTNVPNYLEVIYENLYENIDLRYYSSDKGLKYEFIVHPSGNPKDIRLTYNKVGKLYIDSKDNLIFPTQIGNLIDSNLLIYQKNNDIKNKIEGNFKILDSNAYGFEITGEYYREKDLVIDPLIYSTYIGSTENDVGNGISVDSNGNTYITGYTEGPNFPNTTGAFDTSHNNSNDVFLVKLNHNGTALIYSTFIGGNGSEEGKDITIDSDENVYITGFTNSVDFPCTSGAYNSKHNGETDVFLIKLNPAGNGVNDLLYSSYFGGKSFEEGRSIAIDSNNKVYMTGRTKSLDFPKTTGAYDETYNGGGDDVFLAKLNPIGSGLSDLVYSTYIGGDDYEIGNGITVDSTDNAYITGLASSNFPTTPGAFNNVSNGFYDGFIIKLNPMGTGLSDLVYSTYFGGNNYEESNSIAIDIDDNAYVTGKTYSNNFPTTSSAYDTSFNGAFDLFALKLNSSGSSLGYSTFIGSSSEDQGDDIVIDPFGNAYITGYSSSNNFPITADIAYDTSYNGDVDVVVIKLNPSGSTLIYSTYVGGILDDYGYGVTIDSDSIIYVVGSTKSNNFPNTLGVYDPSYNGGSMDSFGLKLEINFFPSVIDLNVSTSFMLRNNTMNIYSNGTDIEDLESELTPTFEYKYFNHITWLNKSLGTPAYINNRWQISLIMDKTATLGYYDFRVRYTDTGLMVSDWYYLNNGLYVQNNLPEIEDLTLLKAQAFQNKNLSATVNGTDIEDFEKKFFVTVEYRVPTWELWNSTLISDKSFKFKEMKYIGNRWVLNFSIPFGASFGYYDFRANITDTDDGYSGWLYSNNSLLISNCIPELLDIGLSQYTIYRNESVFLLSNCNDYETPENNLGFQAEYKHENDSEWRSLPSVYQEDHWRSEFIPEIDSKLGRYDFKVKFEDNVNASTGWQYADENLMVLNNPPSISYDLDDINIGIRPEIINLTPFEIDVEDDDENLVWSVPETNTYNYFKSVKIIDQTNDTLEIVPLINVTGVEDIELILTDKDGGVDTRSNITLHINSTIAKYTPKVTLLSPPDKSIVNTLTPKLEWKLDYKGDELVTYTVFIDENPVPQTERATGLTSTSYLLENILENGKTYFWYVVPNWGVTLSKPFNFTVDTDFKIEHNVTLTSERSFVSVKQGESVTINLTVKNNGNVRDAFKIEYNAMKLSSEITLNKTNLQLEKGSSFKIRLDINPSKDFEIDTYLLSIKAVSLGNSSVFDEVSITVEVLSRFFIPNYDVALEVLPSIIDIEQAQAKNVTLFIKNIGNTADEYNIGFSSLTFNADAIEIPEALIFLISGSTERVNVTITIPEDMDATTHTIFFKVKSYNAIADAELTVNVLEKGSNIPSDENKKKKDNDSTLLVEISIIIIIIVVLIILFIFIKRKKEEKYLQSIKKEAEEKEEIKSEPIEESDITTEDLPMAQPMEIEATTDKIEPDQATTKTPSITRTEPSQQDSSQES